MVRPFVESSTEAEQQKIYRDFGDQLVTFVVECYNSTLERLNSMMESFRLMFV